jgi:hypothetical protein
MGKYSYTSSEKVDQQVFINRLLCGIANELAEGNRLTRIRMSDYVYKSHDEMVKDLEDQA